MKKMLGWLYYNLYLQALSYDFNMDLQCAVVNDVIDDVASVKMTSRITLVIEPPFIRDEPVIASP